MERHIPGGTEHEISDKPKNELAEAAAAMQPYLIEGRTGPQRPPYMTHLDLYGYIGQMTDHGRGRITGTCRNGCHCIATYVNKQGNGLMFFGAIDVMRAEFARKGVPDTMVVGSQYFEYGEEEKLAKAWLNGADFGSDQMTIDESFRFPFYTNRSPMGSRSLLHKVCQPHAKFEAPNTDADDFDAVRALLIDPRFADGEHIPATELQPHLPAPGWIGPNGTFVVDNLTVHDSLIIGHTVAKQVGRMSLLGALELQHLPDNNLPALLTETVHALPTTHPNFDIIGTHKLPDIDRRGESHQAAGQRIKAITARLADTFPHSSNTYVEWDGTQQ